MTRWLRAVFHNWQIKLTCLAAATLIWLFIKHNVRETPAPHYTTPAPMAPNY